MLVDMARTYTYEAFERVALIARNCLAVLDDGDMLRTQLAILRKLTRYEPVNLIALKRDVAARVLEKAGFVA